MKVLIVNDYATATGGAEHMSLSLREGMRKRGHDARLFSSSARALPGAPILADYTCYGTQSPLRRVIQAVNPLAAQKLARVLQEFQPDVVHVRMFLSQLSPLILPVLRAVPALLHVVNYDLICPVNTKLLPDGSACHQREGEICHTAGCMSRAGMVRLSVQRRLLWRGFDAFKLVVTNSQWVRRRLTEEGVRVDEVVWNGVPVSPQRPPLPQRPTIAYAGRLVPKKGVQILIEAMSHVVKEIPNVRLDIAGDGPMREDLAKRIDAAQLTAHVRFLGHLSREALEREFAGAWAQVAPSLWDEPFGLVAAEAMMRGTAAVVSATGGLGEQVVDGETGFHVPPGDAVALAGALIRLLRDRQYAEEMGAAARAHALANFTEDHVIGRFEELYHRLIAGRPAQSSLPAAQPEPPRPTPATGAA